MGVGPSPNDTHLAKYCEQKVARVRRRRRRRRRLVVVVVGVVVVVVARFGGWVGSIHRTLKIVDHN